MDEAQQGPSQQLTRSVTAAVTAARDGERQAFDAAVDDLGRGGARRPDPDQVGVVLGLLLGELLERAYPDGIDSDDAEQVVERCLRTFRPWYPEIDEDQLIRALAGALRIDTYNGPDAVTVADRPALVAHGVLIVSDLVSAGGETLGPLLTALLDTLRREGALEQP